MGVVEQRYPFTTSADLCCFSKIFVIHFYWPFYCLIGTCWLPADFVPCFVFVSCYQFVAYWGPPSRTHPKKNPSSLAECSGEHKEVPSTLGLGPPSCLQVSGNTKGPYFSCYGSCWAKTSLTIPSHSPWPIISVSVLIRVYDPCRFSKILVIHLSCFFARQAYTWCTKQYSIPRHGSQRTNKTRQTNHQQHGEPQNTQTSPLPCQCSFSDRENRLLSPNTVKARTWLEVVHIRHRGIHSQIASASRLGVRVLQKPQNQYVWE